MLRGRSLICPFYFLMLTTFKFLPGQSFIHRLDPRTKLTIILLVMIATIVVEDVRVLAALFVLSFGYYLLARLPWRATWKAWAVVLFFSVVIIGLINSTLFGHAPPYIHSAHPFLSFPTIKLGNFILHRVVTCEIVFEVFSRMLRHLPLMPPLLPSTFSTTPSTNTHPFHPLATS